MAATTSFLNDKRSQYALGLAVFVALGLAGWFGYSYYTGLQEQAAYKDLAESIDGYVKAHSLDLGAQKWNDVERAFESGAQRHTGSKLYPYFLAYKAEALVQQGKLKEAAGVLDTVVSNINTQQPLYSVYALKRALIKIDTNDEILGKQGKDELLALVNDPKSPMHTLAAHYKDKLGL